MYLSLLVRMDSMECVRMYCDALLTFTSMIKVTCAAFLLLKHKPPQLHSVHVPWISPAMASVVNSALSAAHQCSKP